MKFYGNKCMSNFSNKDLIYKLSIVKYLLKKGICTLTDFIKII